VHVTQSAHDLADQNLIEAIREHARWQAPCESVEESGLLMVAGANAFPAAFRNCMARLDSAVSPREALDRARDFFGRRGRGYTVMLRDSRDADLDQALRSSGLTPSAAVPCMLIECPLPEPAIPPGVRVEPFRELRHVRDAVEINAQAYEVLKLPAAEARVYFGRPEALLSSRVAGFVAYRGTQAVSTALTIFSGRSAGVYWVGTAGAAQRTGLGEICTRLATNAGFQHGASVVTLQATPFGEPLYRKLGYRTYDRLRRYRPPASSA
jgi:ribosomal protein S18 acetylase RimI-like enzyme